MTIPWVIFVGVEAGPVTSTLSHIAMMVCSLFSVADRATLWAGCGFECISLCHLLAMSTVRDVLVDLALYMTRANMTST